MLGTQSPDTGAQEVERACAEAQLRARIEDRVASVVVVGLGFIGALLAESARDAGFPVHGVDRDPEVASNVGARLGLPVSTGCEALDRADVVILAVRALVRDEGAVDLEPLNSACRALTRAAPRARLVLVESTLPPGLTRAIAARLGPRAYVVHSPERLSVGHGVADLARIPHLVAGTDAAATRLGTAMLSALVHRVVPVSAPEVSELSKLLENAFLTTSIALVEEVSRLAREHGVAGSEVTAAAATKPFGYLAFHPGPGVGGHCLPNDLQILRGAFTAQGGSALLSAVTEVVADLPERVITRLEVLLSRAGIGLEGAAVLLVGVGFKVGSSDVTETPARAIVRGLRQRGAVPAYLDTRVPAFSVDGTELRRVAPEALDGSFQAVIVLAGDPGLRGADLCAPVVLDAGGGRALAGPLEQAERL